MAQSAPHILEAGAGSGVLAAELLGELERLGQLPDLVVGRVEDVAARAYRACFNDEVVTVPGVLNQTAALASRTAPKWLLRRLTGVLGRRVL